MYKKMVKISDTESKEIQIPEIGDTVIYHDPHNIPHNALVTDVHGGSHDPATCKWSYPYAPCINLLWVSSDKTKGDSYGRQIERATSTPSGMMPGMAHGNYYRFENEPAIKR